MRRGCGHAAGKRYKSYSVPLPRGTRIRKRGDASLLDPVASVYQSNKTGDWHCAAIVERGTNYPRQSEIEVTA